jgi:hypothetical protein
MWAWAAMLLVLALSESAPAAAPSDRLDHFRDLARRYAEAPEPGVDGPLLSELWRVVDAEIGDNLRSGAPFSSTGFIQSRLDAFSDEWGGASFKVTEPHGPVKRAPIIGLFTLTHGEPRSSFRIYDRTGALLTAVTHEGQLDLRPWSTTAGARQFLVSWVGAQTGTEGRTMHVELWRVRVESAPIRDWSSDDAFPAGLPATGFSARGHQLVVRYQVRYPGWKPGCPEQTEQEDVYRPSPRSTGLQLAQRRVLNGWHRELQSAVVRFFAALGAGDRKTMAELVPDPSLRARLPGALRAESVCDERRAAPPATVIVAATRERDGQRVPWSLTWRRESRGWRLTTAGPMLE